MIDKNQQALLELLKASLFGAEPVFPEDVDWDAVLQEAKDQTVVALAAPAVPKEEAAKWQIPVAQNKAFFVRILDEQTKLVKLFSDAGIPMVILKGCAAAMYYPVPMQRTMGDIDFIVPPDRLEEANQLMADNGYTFVSAAPRHNKYTKNEIELELHNRYSDDKWDIEPLIMDGLVHADTCEVYAKQFPALPTAANGLVLLDHIRMHLYNGLGLRQIVDWMMYVHSFLSDNEAWERFAPIVREAGLETFALTVTKMSQLYFGLPDEVPWCDKADQDTAYQLLKTVFDFGNFGRKNRDDKPMEGLMMEATRSGLFYFLQTTGENTWEAYHKHPSLKPFAWLYQICRFAKRGTIALIRGEKKKLNSADAKKKCRLLEKLGIVYSSGRSKKRS